MDRIPSLAPMNRTVALFLGGLVGCLATVFAASPALGAVDPPALERFEKAQAKRDFVIYVPSTAIGEPITAFESYACNPQTSNQLVVQFGSDARPGRTPTSISLGQSPAWCEDGPDPIGPVTTFTFRGQKVQVFGACPGSDGRECKRSTPALVKKFGYLTVIVPGTRTRPTPTHIEVYTRGLSVAEIRTFIRGLTPAP